MSAARRELDRVGEQVRDDAFGLDRIDRGDGQVGGDLAPQRDALQLARAARQLERMVDDHRDVGGLPAQREPSRLDAFRVDQVLRHRQRVAHTRVDAVGEVGLLLVESSRVAVEQQGRERLDDAERVLQVVADRREELHAKRAGPRFLGGPLLGARALHQVAEEERDGEEERDPHQVLGDHQLLQIDVTRERVQVGDDDQHRRDGHQSDAFAESADEEDHEVEDEELARGVAGQQDRRRHRQRVEGDHAPLEDPAPAQARHELGEDDVGTEVDGDEERVDRGDFDQRVAEDDEIRRRDDQDPTQEENELGSAGCAREVFRRLSYGACGAGSCCRLRHLDRVGCTARASRNRNKLRNK